MLQLRAVRSVRAKVALPFVACRCGRRPPTVSRQPFLLRPQPALQRWIALPLAAPQPCMPLRPMPSNREPPALLIAATASSPALRCPTTMICMLQGTQHTVHTNFVVLAGLGNEDAEEEDGDAEQEEAGEPRAVLVNRKTAPRICLFFKGRPKQQVPVVLGISRQLLKKRIEEYVAQKENLTSQRAKRACKRWTVFLYFECHQVQADNKSKFTFRAWGLRADFKQDPRFDFVQEAGELWSYSHRYASRQCRPVIQLCAFIRIRLHKDSELGSKCYQLVLARSLSPHPAATVCPEGSGANPTLP